MFVIKAGINDANAATFTFSEVKTMYGGKHIGNGDLIFIFASETDGGAGLLACGIVTSAQPTPIQHGLARQTPRVSIVVQRTALAKKRLGRSELKKFSECDDGRPESELHFKFYRQATNKIGGISEEAVAFLRKFF